MKKGPPRAAAATASSGSPVRSASTKVDRAAKAVATFKRTQLQSRARNELLAESSDDEPVAAAANGTVDLFSGAGSCAGFTTTAVESPAQSMNSDSIDLTGDL